MKKEEKQAKDSLSIHEEAGPGEDLDDGYYLDSDYEDESLEFSQEDSWDEDLDWNVMDKTKEKRTAIRGKKTQEDKGSETMRETDKPIKGEAGRDMESGAGSENKHREEKRAWQMQEEARAKEEAREKAREEVLRKAEEAVAKAEVMMNEARVEELERRRTRALERARNEGRRRQGVAELDSDRLEEELIRMKGDWREPIREEERLANMKSTDRGREPDIQKKMSEFKDEINAREGMGPGNKMNTNEKSSQAKKNEKPKKGKAGKIAAGVTGAVLVAGAAAYCVLAQSYKEQFFPNTMINGMEAGGKDVFEVEEMISSAMDGYQITLTDRDGTQEVVTKDAVGLHTVFDGTLETMLEEQNPYLWGIHLFKTDDRQISTMAAYDEAAFRSTAEGLKFFDPSYIRQKKEAYLSDYIEGTGYEIIPEEPGNELKKEVFMEALSEAMLTMQPQLVLEEAGCYVNPLPGDPDPALVKQRDELNRFAQMTVTYTFGSREEVLNGDKIHQWVTFDEENQPVVNEELAAEFVAELGEKYNTTYSTRKFKTTYGEEVEVSGPYGWKIDQDAETAALIQIIKDGESMVREPEYEQEGASREEKDYGDTYVEVNLTAQHLYVYKDGKNVMESDFVSGNVARGYTTPPGLYSIAYKQQNAVLRGPGYASPVRFWMPFNRGIGFHDANWRGSFGGSIYRTNGSHGCVNMPYSTAKELYDYVYTGMPVICYNLDGTSNTKSTNASGGGPIAAAPAAPTAPAAPAAPVVTPEIPVAAPVIPQDQADGMGGGGVVSGIPGQTESAAPEVSAQTDPVVLDVPSGENAGGGSTVPQTPAETPVLPAEVPTAPAVPETPVMPPADVPVIDVPAIP